jgi:hypothetical protein
LQELTQTSSNQLDIGNLIFATGLASGSTMSTGSVGIGTTAPAATLQIAAGTSTGTNGYGLEVAAPSGATNNYAAAFTGGNVGIGTTTPAAPLDVNGGVHLATSATGGTAVLWNSAGTLTWGSTALTVGGSVTASGATGYFPYFTSATTLGDSVVYQTGSNVGIGTTSPSYLLTTGSAGSIGILNSPNATGTADAIIFANPSYPTSYNNSISSEISGTPSAARLNFNVTNSSSSRATVMTLLGTGDVGIANTSPSYLLQVGSGSASGIVMELQNSSGACTYSPGSSSVTVSCSSDARLKTDIVDSHGALASLEDMRVRDFTWKPTGERKTGVVAQEMLQTHPDMVHTGKDGYYTVDEPNPWKLIEAVQELKQLIAAQQQEIIDDKQQIADLKQLISAHQKETGDLKQQNRD